MIFGTLRLVYRIVTFIVVAYVFFAVPLGERTLYEHVRRIVSTEEAKDLGAELREAGARVSDRIDDDIRVDASGSLE